MAEFLPKQIKLNKVYTVKKIYRNYNDSRSLCLEIQSDGSNQLTDKAYVDIHTTLREDSAVTSELQMSGLNENVTGFTKLVATTKFIIKARAGSYNPIVLCDFIDLLERD